MRDLMIGIQFVGHGGRIARAGGRVVKNVAGYDLMKVMTGSFGTLGIVTEATSRCGRSRSSTRWRSRDYDRIAQAFDAAAKLLDALPLVSSGSAESDGPAHCSEPTASFCCSRGFREIEPEIGYQRNRIAEILAREANLKCVEMLADGCAIEAYERLRDFEFPPGNLTAQLAVLPAELARCLPNAARSFALTPDAASRRFRSTAAGAEAARTALTRWRAIAASARGHLRVLNVPPELRAELSQNRFDSPGEGALKLMRRLKASFDPAGIFNPGCFVGGI